MKHVFKVIVLVFLIITYVFAHDMPVHQHIVREAYKLLSYSVGNIPKLDEHIGNNEFGNAPWSIGKVVAGAYREDLENPVYCYSGNSPINEISGIEAPLISITHFWDSDAGDGSKIKLVGGVYENAYIKALRYISPKEYGRWNVGINWPKGTTIFDKWDGGEIRVEHMGRIVLQYDNLIDLYKTRSAYVVGTYNILGQLVGGPGLPCHVKLDEGQMHDYMVWEILGRISHLLADMSVPAHVHNDIHPSGDSYEGYMSSNYASFGASYALETGNIY